MNCPRCGSSRHKVETPKRTNKYFDIRTHYCYDCSNDKPTTFKTFEVPLPLEISTPNIVIMDQFEDCPIYTEVYNGYHLAKSISSICGLDKEMVLEIIKKLAAVFNRIPADHRCLSKTQLIIITTQLIFRAPYEGITYRKVARKMRRIATNKDGQKEITSLPAYRYLKHYYHTLDFTNESLQEDKSLSVLQFFISVITKETSFYSQNKRKETALESDLL